MASIRFLFWSKGGRGEEKEGRGGTDGHQKEGEDEEEEEKRDGDGVRESEGGIRVRRW